MWLNIPIFFNLQGFPDIDFVCHQIQYKMFLFLLKSKLGQCMDGCISHWEMALMSTFPLFPLILKVSLKENKRRFGQDNFSCSSMAAAIVTTQNYSIYPLAKTRCSFYRQTYYPERGGFPPRSSIITSNSVGNRTSTDSERSCSEVQQVLINAQKVFTRRSYNYKWKRFVIWQLIGMLIQSQSLYNLFLNTCT